MRLLDFLPSNKKNTLAIAGLNKNAGKTVVLNRLLTEAANLNIAVGITSIGYDGEKRDMLSGTQKPQVWVAAGTIVATAASIIEKTKLDIEIVTATGQHTPLGEVYIIRYHQAGYTELVGPSSLRGLQAVKLLMHNSTDLVLIDGALNRLSQISPQLCDVAYLAVGGQRNLNEIIKRAQQQLCLFDRPLAPNQVLGPARELLKNKKNAWLSPTGEFLDIPHNTRLLPDGQVGWYVNSGALSETVAKKVYKQCQGIIVGDVSTVFVSAKVLSEMQRNNFNIYVARKLPLAAITINPAPPGDVPLDIIKLGMRISAITPNIPVIDVVSSLSFRGGELIGRLG